MAFGWLADSRFSGSVKGCGTIAVMASPIFRVIALFFFFPLISREIHDTVSDFRKVQLFEKGERSEPTSAPLRPHLGPQRDPFDSIYVFSVSKAESAPRCSWCSWCSWRTPRRYPGLRQVNGFHLIKIGASTGFHRSAHGRPHAPQLEVP